MPISLVGVVTGFLFDTTDPFDGADPTWPTGVRGGDLAFLGMGICDPGTTPPAITGWDLRVNQQLGAGTVAAGTGARQVALYSRICSDTDTGTLQVPAPTGTVDIVANGLIVYRADSGLIDVDYDYGQDTDAATSISITKANPGTDRERVGDWMAGFIVAPANSNLSSQTFSATGATYGTAVERVDNGSAGGHAIRCSFIDRPVTAGVATAATVYTSTALLTAGCVFMRLRENPNLKVVRPLLMTLSRQRG